MNLCSRIGAILLQLTEKKDDFHNIIFGIDKMGIFGIFDPTTQINFVCLKEVVSQERPLEFRYRNFR